MQKYSQEKKQHALALMSPPENRSVPEVAARTGIPTATLYLWQRQARAHGRAVPASGGQPETWGSADKFRVVLETAPLVEAELAEYCRGKGLYVEQVRAWRAACEAANDAAPRDATERKADRRRIKELEKDLRYKEKALAETAALLVLSRKLEALWTESEDA